MKSTNPPIRGILGRGLTTWRLCRMFGEPFGRVRVGFPRLTTLPHTADLHESPGRTRTAALIEVALLDLSVCRRVQTWVDLLFYLFIHSYSNKSSTSAPDLIFVDARQPRGSLVCRDCTYYGHLRAMFLKLTCHFCRFFVMVVPHLVPSPLSTAGSLSDIDIVSRSVISLKQRRCKLVHIFIQLTGRTGFKYFEST